MEEQGVAWWRRMCMMRWLNEYMHIYPAAKFDTCIGHTFCSRNLGTARQPLACTSRVANFLQSTMEEEVKMIMVCWGNTIVFAFGWSPASHSKPSWKQYGWLLTLGP